MKTFLFQLRGAVLGTVVLAAVCCGIYPMAVWAVARVAFPSQAGGSLIVDRDGVVRGSRLLAQGFSAPGYFHPRPSAAGANGYDATASGGSNLGPTSQKLHDILKDRIAAYRAENGLAPNDAIPADAVTSSGSGLDPHITPANAEIQAARVAKARGLDRERILRLVREHTSGPFAALVGEARVNVLELNLALDRP
jgi:K+-transporting ATPase ATPase C chain